ncbi:MAG: aminotransferase class V-fold PLP-dependent enzyme [Bacteroidia bacterium]|nr:aminotransferase class V-fold PLP-dependent enzyme [Bacteroidia bacterium]
MSMISPEQLARIRTETPGIPGVIHFNSAGSSLPPASVMAASITYLQQEAEQGGYELMMSRNADLEAVYGLVANMIGAQPEDIALCESATDGWYRALHSIAWKDGDEILMSRAEYGANYLGYLALKEKFGVETRLVEDNEFGEIDLIHLENSITSSSRLIALSHMPTNGGLVNPAEEVGAIARKHGLIYLLDACQTVGQKPLDVAALQCDFLAATGRKFMRGPRGTGFLYVRPEILDQLHPPRPDLWSAKWVGPQAYEWLPGARRFENFEFSRALRLGLGEAARYYLEVGPEAIWDRIQQLAALLREKLAAIPGVIVRDKGRVLGGIVTFTIDGHDPDEMHGELMKQKLQLSVNREGTAWLDMPQRGITTMLRASVHYFLEESDIDTLAREIEKGIEV